MRRAFTLIELLVVLAIVLILASLLVVGLAKLWPNVRGTEAQTGLTNIASAVTKLKGDHAMAHKPFAWYINTTGMASPALPTLAELRARAAVWNPAVELCAKRVLPELVIGVPGRWPCMNARLHSRDLPPGDSRSYDFTTYYDPTQRQLSEVVPGTTVLIDPWGRPYQYLIFEQITDVLLADNVTIVKRSIFIEVLASPGSDGQLDATMASFDAPDGFSDVATNATNEDNIFVVLDRWRP